MVEGPKEVYICKSCVELCHNIIKQEIRKASGSPAMVREIPTPREVHTFLDDYIIGQERAKRTLAVSVHNHYKRLQHIDRRSDDDVEIDKSNVLIVGPTGTGKTLMTYDSPPLQEVLYDRDKLLLVSKTSLRLVAAGCSG